MVPGQKSDLCSGASDLAEITWQRLLDQSQVSLQNATYPPPFGAYSHTLPRGVELLV